ncbi:unnamed protein product [Linum trigynum]|uniref:Uncharacterized protein n=1 Tax=Linum trigynum TaxID=586398 RepID=A0AAV2D3R0_9ROSI
MAMAMAKQEAEPELRCVYAFRLFHLPLPPFFNWQRREIEIRSRAFPGFSISDTPLPQRFQSLYRRPAFQTTFGDPIAIVSPFEQSAMEILFTTPKSDPREFCVRKTTSSSNVKRLDVPAFGDSQSS